MSQNKFNTTTLKGPSKTLSQTWITPQYIIDGLGGFEVFDLDPCGYIHPDKGFLSLTAKNVYLLQNGQDGLQLDWYGNVFLNFPYNDSKAWYERMAKHGNGIVLSFVRSDTKAFQDSVKTATGINLLNKRIRFIDSDGTMKSNANAPSCLIAWGEDNYHRIKQLDGICVRIDKDVQEC